MLLSILLLASSLALLSKIFLAVGIDHLVTNPFFYFFQAGRSQPPQLQPIFTSTWQKADIS
jgi:hypothetical protein